MADKSDEILSNLKDLMGAVRRLEENEDSVKQRLAQVERRIDDSAENEGESHVSYSTCPKGFQRTETVNTLHSQNERHSGDMTGQSSDLHYANYREFTGQQSDVEIGNPQSEFHAIKDAVNKLKVV